MNPIVRLINRNLTVSLNPGFLIWQVVFPLIYIFVVGYAYTGLISGVPFGDGEVAYPAYLTTGMIGFNVMNSTLVSGLIIWNDRRHGMFEQIMSGPYTRWHYIMANICTIGIVGLASAGLICAVGFPVFLESASVSYMTVPLVVFAAVAGSALFGSLASIISTRFRSSEGFNVVINATFIFLAFVSTAFYPAQGAPGVLGAAFYANPLTYVVDTIRAGIFGTVDGFVLTEMAVLGGTAAVLVAVAARTMSRLRL